MEMVDKIEKLKKERKAVILAHNYQIPEVQDIADFVGDSLELSIKASQTDAEVIVFCGVHFMAETAKILSPEKTVLLPDKNAGCPMADMITAEQLRALKAEHPGAKVLCYVNTSAEVKAECDLCCTSANAVRMVEEVLKDAKEIIFVPDQYLAAFVAGKTGRQFITWPGFCPTHARILPEHIAGGAGPPSGGRRDGPSGVPPRGGGPRGHRGLHRRDEPLCEGDAGPGDHRRDGAGDHPPPEEGGSRTRSSIRSRRPSSART